VLLVVVLLLLLLLVVGVLLLLLLVVGGVRLGGACMLISAPKITRAAAIVHIRSSREGSGWCAIAVPGLALVQCVQGGGVVWFGSVRVLQAGFRLRCFVGRL